MDIIYLKGCFIMEYLIKIIIDNFIYVIPPFQINIKDFYKLVEVIGYTIVMIMCVYRSYKIVFKAFMEVRIMKIEDIRDFQRKYYLEICLVLGVIEFWRSYMNDIIKF